MSSAFVEMIPNRGRWSKILDWKGLTKTLKAFRGFGQNLGYLMYKTRGLYCILPSYKLVIGDYTIKLVTSYYLITIKLVLSVYRGLYTSSTARGGGGSFKKRKAIGEIGCCESRMSKQKH